MSRHGSSRSALVALERVVRRTPELLSGAAELVVWRGEPAPVLTALGRERIVAVQSFRPLCRALEAAGFRVAHEIPAEFDAAVLLGGRDQRENVVAAARLLLGVRPGAIVVATLENDLGARAFEEEFLRLSGGGTSETLAHSRVIWSTGTEVDRARCAAAIAAGAPAVVPGTRLTAAPGMFSAREIDPGSALLAESLPVLVGRGADLGAGWGFLAEVILERFPAVMELHLVEGERTALELAKANLSPRPGVVVSFHWLDVLTEPLPSGLDWVVMNPPFHRGDRTAVEVGEGFIRRGYGALRPGGILCLVANQHLPYRRILLEMFTDIDEVRSAGGYSVWHCQR